MVQGGTETTLDGVADYTAHLLPALRDAGVDVRPVRFGEPLPDVDLAHFQYAPFGFPDGLAGARCSVPLVTTLHEYGEELVPTSDALVVTNPSHARMLRDRTGREAHHIPLAPNVPVFDVPPRRFDRPTAVFFGFVHPVKGTRYLIEAVRRVPGLGLKVVGGFTSLALPPAEAEEHRRELMALADDRVEFTGHLPAEEVSAVLRGATVAVLPFTHGVTTKSGSLLTVLAHGLPTLVTDAGDPELVDGDTVAIIGAVRSADAIGAELERVLSDSALRQRLSRRGRQMVAERTWPHVARRHRELYEQVLRNA
jgi:glycosyltransferase involved in cell wall biosynthesis